MPSTRIDAWRRIAVLVVIACLVAAYIAVDGGQYLTLERLRAMQGSLELARSAAPLASAAAFFLLYVVVAGLSLPGAAVLTVFAGALFGLGWGTLIVSFASSVGATLSMLAARYLLRGWVQARFGDRLAALNGGIAGDGAAYLFSLRLVPLFPYFLINVASGLTAIPVWTFYWVSQLGMLAGTLVFVNAGTQIAQIASMGDIVSPALLLSFALLGVFPLLARRALAAISGRKVYARWSRPRRYDSNVLVIGAGAAGLVTAYIGAAVRAKVTLVEANRMGGDCLNFGCVPSKALIRSARLAHQCRHAAQYGLDGPAMQPDFPAVMARVHAVIDAIAPHDSAERYQALGVQVVHGYARLRDPWTVDVTQDDGMVRSISARSIVIATGAAPLVPDLPGLAEVGYLTSDTVWDAMAGQAQAPRRLLILGGGPIGCELAQAFARLGAGVTQVEMGPRLMAREDDEVSALAQAALERSGVQVLTACRALRCERVGADKFLVVDDGAGVRRIGFDVLLCAVGRAARLSGFGLEELGVDTGRTVAVNEFLQTRFPNILAAGDVAGPYQFTHVAAHQAWYAAVNALFGGIWRFRVDYSVIPWTTFIDPEVARVGLNEREARERNVAYELTRFELSELDRAIADGATEGFVKILTVPGKDRILGVTIVGDHAGELLAEFVLAMKHGLGLNKVLGTIHSYPTMAEANKYAAGAWKRAHAPQRLLAWLARYHRWQRGGTA